MSHHASGPNFGFPRGDARLDMTDLYAFPKPGDPAKSILIFNVHPSVGREPAGADDHASPSRRARYTKSRLTRTAMPSPISVTASQFASSEDGKQTATLRRIQGARAAGGVRRGRSHRRASTGLGRAGSPGDGSRRLPSVLWLAQRSFLLRRKRLFNNMQFTGDDFFADKNVCSIVLELPNSALGTNKVGIWARTLDKTGEGWIQADRGGRPLQAVFLPGEEREAYLSGEPADDDRFIGVFAHELEHTGGYTPEDAIERRKKAAARHSFL